METDIITILRIIQTVEKPVGASTLCNYSEIPYSQATIGRILSNLEQKGFLKKQANKGRIITKLGKDYLIKHDTSYTQSLIAKELISLSSSDKVVPLLQVLEVRKLLEPFAAEKAAIKATPQEIQEIENLVFAHRYALSKNEPAYKEDLLLHLAIAKAGKNTTLHKILELLLCENDAYQKFSYASETHLEKQIDQHFQLMECIRNHDSIGAKKAMSQHIKSVYSNVREYLDNTND